MVQVVADTRAACLRLSEVGAHLKSVIRASALSTSRSTRSCAGGGSCCSSCAGGSGCCASSSTQEEDAPDEGRWVLPLLTFLKIAQDLDHSLRALAAHVDGLDNIPVHIEVTTMSGASILSYDTTVFLGPSLAEDESAQTRRRDRNRCASVKDVEDLLRNTVLEKVEVERTVRDGEEAELNAALFREFWRAQTEHFFGDAGGALSFRAGGCQSFRPGAPALVPKADAPPELVDKHRSVFDRLHPFCREIIFVERVKMMSARKTEDCSPGEERKTIPGHLVLCTGFEVEDPRNFHEWSLLETILIKSPSL